MKWTGKQTQALENFRAVGGWSTSVEALVEGPAAEGLHRKGLLEKRKILKKTREVAQYRVAQPDVEVTGRPALSASPRELPGYAPAHNGE